MCEGTEVSIWQQQLNPYQSEAGTTPRFLNLCANILTLVSRAAPARSIVPSNIKS